MFLRRLNRFVVEVKTTGGTVRAHCANPGRLWEILVPGRRVILESPEGARAIDSRGAGVLPRCPTARATRKRATSHTLVAAYYRGRVVPLVPVRANSVVGELVIPRLFPETRRGQEGTKVTTEAPLGEGRTDFRIVGRYGTVYVEVKSCSLVEHGVAMFPDAKSDRATRHVDALAQVVKEASHGMPPVRALVVFVVTHGTPELFCPNIHADPVFARTMAARRSTVEYRAVVIRADSSGRTTVVGEIPVLSGWLSIVGREGTHRVASGDSRELLLYAPGIGHPTLTSELDRQLRSLGSVSPASLKNPAFVDGILKLRHRGVLGLL